LPRAVALVSAFVAACVLTLAGTAQAKQVPSGWSWTDYGPELKDVACVQPGTCVAVGENGAVLRSPNTDEVPLAWTMVNLKRDADPPFDTLPVDLVGVSCSNTSCLAVSNTRDLVQGTASWVYRSTDRGATWTAAQKLPAIGTPKTASASAIGCEPGDVSAKTRDCYAAGVDGGIWRSRNDGRSWSALGAPPRTTKPSFNRIACPRANTCVVVGGANTPSSAVIVGDAITSVPAPTGLTSRFSAGACDTADQRGYTSMSVKAKRWGAVRSFRKAPDQQGLSASALACPFENNCVALTGAGLALRTSSLGSGEDWQRRPLPTVLLKALECVETACVAVGKSATWFASLDVGLNWGRVNEVAKFNLGQCNIAQSSTCVAGGDMAVGISRDRGLTWNLPIAGRGALNTKALQCSAPATCLILGQTEMLFTDDFNVFQPRNPPVTAAMGADAQDCVAKSVADTPICVAVTESVTYTSFDGGLTSWAQNGFPGVRPAEIACVPGKTDPVTCLVPNKEFILIGTLGRDPSGFPTWSWRYTNADANHIINVIACSPEGTQCTAAGVQGMILTTTNGTLMDWKEMSIPEGAPTSKQPVYTAVACPQTGFCMVGGKQGIRYVVASTTNNWTDYSYDEVGDITNQPSINGFACESVNRCVALGSSVFLGLRSAQTSRTREISNRSRRARRNARRGT
jgi:photosystem II stability/assembly factor-like uncharacterized protein